MGAASRGRRTRSNLQPYRCFLVRCRLEAGASPRGEVSWRFNVQQADRDATRHSFTSLQDVAAYFEAELAATAALADAKRQDDR